MQTLNFIKKVTPHWVTGSISTPVGPVPSVAADWSWPDFRGMIKSRVSAFRMNYTVEPGLYAVGKPDANADVFATANYKLSFDMVRQALKGMHAWLLVLDTKSINVWCAAGKGTFGTDELIKRIMDAGLEKVVAHKRIILPQLGAVGVNAGSVQKRTGFRVSYGPVEARDIPAYVQAGYVKTKEMSMIRFPILDRMILTPMELNPAMKKFPWFAGGALVLFGLQPAGILFEQAWAGGLPFILLLLISVISGAFVTPVLLPFIPFRSFALKGLVTGLVSVFLGMQSFQNSWNTDALLKATAWLFFPAVSSYLALQFTGATTYTGMSGVNKELKPGIPLYLAAAGISGILLVLFKLKEWGIV